VPILMLIVIKTDSFVQVKGVEHIFLSLYCGMTVQYLIVIKEIELKSNVY